MRLSKVVSAYLMLTHSVVVLFKTFYYFSGTQVGILFQVFFGPSTEHMFSDVKIKSLWFEFHVTGGQPGVPVLPISKPLKPYLFLYLRRRAFLGFPSYGSAWSIPGLPDAWSSSYYVHCPWSRLSRYIHGRAFPPFKILAAGLHGPYLVY